MSLLEDAQGTKLEVGQRVAFNYSGAVALGEIVELKDGKASERWPNQYDYSHRPHIRIKREAAWLTDSSRRKPISDVRDPHSLAVISTPVPSDPCWACGNPLQKISTADRELCNSCGAGLADR